MIPMIDTILILLIFYMSFSSLRGTEKQIGARLPNVPPPGTPMKALPPMEQIVLHVNDRDDIVVNGSPRFDRESLLETLRQVRYFERPDLRIIVEANPGTSYQAVMGALDVCARASLTNVAFRPLS